MSVLSDKTLQALSQLQQIITPFEPNLVKTGSNISYGLSSYGYDARMADEIEICSEQLHSNAIIDPKEFDKRIFTKQNGKEFILPPHSFALTRTFEHFSIPNNMLVICLGKSTYARCGMIVNVTPLEPGWRGYVTLELSNTTPYPIKIYALEGICQFIFLQGDRDCLTSYSSRSGKYMDQTGIVHAKL